MTENKSNRTPIIVAIIGLVGLLGTAIIGNSEKFANCGTPPPTYINVVGTWIGDDNRNPAPITLVIGQQNDNSFSGILSQKSYRVAFTGSIDGNTRRITIKDTRVISQNPQKDGGDWSLAETNGVISNDGGQIITVGDDKYGRINGTFVKQY